VLCFSFRVFEAGVGEGRAKEPRGIFITKATLSMSVAFLLLVVDALKVVHTEVGNGGLKMATYLAVETYLPLPKC
jgi:hypothetical protein